jgi:hypothetical protein
MIAISLSMLNQSIDWIDDNFKLAERWTPNDPLLAHNRAIAFARGAKKPSADSWTFEHLNSLNTQTRLFELGNRSRQQMDDLALVA